MARSVAPLSHAPPGVLQGSRSLLPRPRLGRGRCRRPSRRPAGLLQQRESHRRGCPGQCRLHTGISGTGVTRRAGAPLRPSIPRRLEVARALRRDEGCFPRNNRRRPGARSADDVARRFAARGLPRSPGIYSVDPPELHSAEPKSRSPRMPPERQASNGTNLVFCALGRPGPLSNGSRFCCATRMVTASVARDPHAHSRLQQSLVRQTSHA